MVSPPFRVLRVFRGYKFKKSTFRPVLILTNLPSITYPTYRPISNGDPSCLIVLNRVIFYDDQLLSPVFISAAFSRFHFAFRLQNMASFPFVTDPDEIA